MVKSIAELIEMKANIEGKRNEIKTMYIESIDSDVKFKLANRIEVVKIQDMEKTDLDPYLIFNHIVEPNLSDPQLQEIYNKNREPFKIIDELFNMEEVGRLSLAIIGQERKGDIVKDIKNS